MCIEETQENMAKKESQGILENCLKLHMHSPAHTGLSSQSYGFSSSCVWMWGLDHKEGWAPKNRCFQIGVLDKTLESPSDSKEIKPVNPKGNQPWIFIRRTDAKAEAPVILSTWCKDLTHWKRPWCWGRLKTRGEVGERGWDGWMVSLTQWTFIWANSGR